MMAGEANAHMSRRAWRSLATSFWALQTAGWLLYWLMIVVTFWPVAAEGTVARLVHVKLARSVIGFALSSLLRPIYKRAAGRASLPGLAALVLVCSAAFGCVWTALEAGYRKLTLPTFDAADTLARSPRIALDYAVTLVAWSALYLGLKYWRSWQGERERALKSEALAQKAQLEALRYQLNPHFLFNSLNSLRALIDDDPRRARRMVTELAEFMRHSLVRKDGELVPLRAELETIENYLSIEKVRFEDGLDVVFDVDAAAEGWRVPPFLLHPLIENAVKHGMRTSPPPLRIELCARRREGRLRIEVSNTGSWQPAESNGAPGSDGTGTGLSNVRARLEQLFPGRHSFRVAREDGWIRTVVEIEGGVNGDG